MSLFPSSCSAAGRRASLTNEKSTYPGWDEVGKAWRGRALVPAHALTEGIGWSRGRFELTGLFLTECRSASDA